MIKLMSKKVNCNQRLYRTLKYIILLMESMLGSIVAVIAHSILATNSVGNAEQSAAAEIFALAIRGYVELEPTTGGITLRRTNKPAKSIALEERLLLNAVTPEVTLTIPHQLPVAQTIGALACQLLRHQKFAHKLTPQRLVRRTSIGYYVFMAAAGIAPIIIFPSGEIVCAAIALVVFCISGWNGSVKPIKAWAIFYTKKGNRRAKRLRERHQRIHANNMHSRAYWLPYELLWTAHVPLYHAPTHMPSWFKGEWPTTPQDRSALLREMFSTIAAALNQPVDKKGRYTANTAILDEARPYLAIDDLKTAGGIILDATTNADTSGDSA